MNEEDLVDLLDRLGRDVHVTPAPLDRIFSERSRLHRRRIRWTALGSIATAALIVTASIAVAQGTDPAGQTPSAQNTTGAQPSLPAPSAEATLPVAPAGKRMVGVGHASIAVPQSWGTNQIRCGPTSATTNTVVINVSLYLSCAAGLAPGASVAQVEHASELPNTQGSGPRATLRSMVVLRSAHESSARSRALATPPAQELSYIQSESASFQVTSYQASVVVRLLNSIHVDTHRSLSRPTSQPSIRTALNNSSLPRSR